jgi:hypothetical protein
MSRKPILSPIVEIKIPQDPNYDGHVRRQTPESLEAHAFSDCSAYLDLDKVLPM